MQSFGLRGSHLMHVLELARCPHCFLDTPHLQQMWAGATKQYDGQRLRHWAVYQCVRCGGVTLAWAGTPDGPVQEYFPKSQGVSEAIPARVRDFLQQAIDSQHAAAGAVMLAASAVDAMLKNKGYRAGSLYKRIDQAANDHLITAAMATWAHEVRLDANDQRHADEEAELPTREDAPRAIEFATALAEFLFVLPSRVMRGLKEVGVDIEGTTASEVPGT